jgi:putative SOS response-associated peptidase YedK
VRIGTICPSGIRQIVTAVNVAPNFAPNWSLAPAQPGRVVRRHPETGERHLGAMAWGFLPNWAKELKGAVRPINARAETLGTSTIFRSAARARRCLAPADTFCEWHRTEQGTQPYAISRQDGVL